MKKGIIVSLLLMVILAWTVATTANYIIYNLEVVEITGQTVELRIMGENHFYASARD